jgi:hypothetical protein
MKFISHYLNLQNKGIASKNNSQQANNTGTSALLTTFLHHKFYRHSGPTNQQNQQKHGSFNSGICHRKLPPSYSTYSAGGGRLTHHSFHQEIITRKRLVHRISSGGGALGHLGIIVSITTYATVAPAHPCVNLQSP